MQGVKDQLLEMKEQKTIKWNQHGVSDIRSNVGRQIHDIYEPIEKPATIKSNCNK